VLQPRRDTLGDPAPRGLVLLLLKDLATQLRIPAGIALVRVGVVGRRRDNGHGVSVRSTGGRVVGSRLLEFPCSRPITPCAPCNETAHPGTVAKLPEMMLDIIGGSGLMRRLEET
jgi:hypothetical protein